MVLLFNAKIAIASWALSKTLEKWVKFTIFNPSKKKERKQTTCAVLNLGIFFSFSFRYLKFETTCMNCFEDATKIKAGGILMKKIFDAQNFNEGILTPGILGNTYWTRQCPNIYSTRQYFISTELDKTQISTQLDKTQISTQLDNLWYLLN